MTEPTRDGDASAADGFGWLCPSEVYRARMLDMGPRVRRARTQAVIAAAVGMTASIALGALLWATLLLFAVAVVNLATLDWRIARAKRPERVVAASLALITVVLGCSAMLTGGAASPAVAWLVIPVAMTAARFRAVVVWAAAGFASLVALVVAAADNPARAIDHPLPLLGVLVLLCAVTAITTALMDAEVQYRNESVLDPLTGLLNRSALESRFAEVGEQARVVGRPVCLIMCDLDRFKRTNDTHGHDHGDKVLREVSYEMRKSLRSFELFFRIGGEEFLVLLPGVDLRQGTEIAESMRVAVEHSRPGGLPITASLGVSVGTGDEIEFQSLYRAADDALYRAKSAGRNMVVAAGMQAPDQDLALELTQPAPLIHSFAAGSGAAAGPLEDRPLSLID